MIRLISAGVLFIAALLTWRLGSSALGNQPFANQIFKTETAAPDNPAIEARNVGFDTEAPTGGASGANPDPGDKTRAGGLNTGIPASTTASPSPFPEVAPSPAAQSTPVTGVW